MRGLLFRFCLVRNILAKMVAPRWQKIWINKGPAVGRLAPLFCFGAAGLQKGNKISRTSHFKVKSLMQMCGPILHVLDPRQEKFQEEQD